MANPATTNAQDEKDRQTREARLTQRLVVAVRGPQNQLHDTSGHKKNRKDRTARPSRATALPRWTPQQPQGCGRAENDLGQNTVGHRPTQVRGFVDQGNFFQGEASGDLKPSHDALTTHQEKKITTAKRRTAGRASPRPYQNHVEQCRQPNQ